MEIFKTANNIESDLSLKIFTENFGHRQYPVHVHEFVEILYITDGECQQTVNNLTYTARRGDLIFINKGSTHAFGSSGSYTYYNICFAPETVIQRVIDRENALDLLSLTALEEIQSEDAPIGRLTFEGEERQWIEYLLKDMLAEYEAHLPERTAILESYMTVLIAKILRKAHVSPSTKGVAFDGVWRALSEFIDENLTQKMTLEDLAQKCFYSPSYFSRIFKQKFGITLVDYLAKERAHLAADLLTSTTLSMEAIAEKCGFGNKSGLYRAFEKTYGCSPSEYRKNEKK